MSTLQEHCKQSLRTFGKEYWMFHHVIDWFAGKEGYCDGVYFNYKDEPGKPQKKYQHKEMIHNVWFIDKIRGVYGQGPADALVQHVKADFGDHELFRNMLPEKHDERIFHKGYLISSFSQDNVGMAGSAKKETFSDRARIFNKKSRIFGQKILDNHVYNITIDQLVFLPKKIGRDYLNNLLSMYCPEW